MENTLKIIGIILFLGISSYVLYLASSDPKALISNTYVYLIFGIVSLLIGLYLLLVRGKFSKTLLIILLAFVGFISLIFIYLTTTISKSLLVNYILNIVVFLIIFIGLMLIGTLITNILKRNEGWTGFITNFIFYIPCLINDLIAYVLNDFYSTPQIFFTLFIIEILLVLYFIYAIPAIQTYIKRGGISIQSDPVFLNTLTTLDSTTVKTMTTNIMTVEIDICGNKIYNPEGNNNPTNIRTNFSISMWTYLNPPNTSRIPVGSEANIFYYGSIIPESSQTNASGTSYHPQITYAIDNLYNGFYKIYIDSNNVDSTQHPIYFTVDTDILPYQKWNNIVFTYSQNTVDVFINGDLVKSTHLSKSPLFSNYDTMVIGTDSSSLYMTSYPNHDPDIDGPMPQPTYSPIINTISRNGLYGSVCNVVYYPTFLDRGKIRTIYNYLVVKNPPIY
jgi:hypothetical protein